MRKSTFRLKRQKKKKKKQFTVTDISFRRLVPLETSDLWELCKGHKCSLSSKSS